ncbi:MAG TPA: energy transducer TonB [Pyrinomonadaceae bacterium]|jgi:TonB family C-terminal domain|nr:energy transducer TonB [Pyrinomonadaceae bacterium]
MRRLCATLVLLLGVVFSTPAHASERPTKIGILDFGSADLGKLVAQHLRSRFHSNPSIQLIDADLSASAARGAGYTGSLNMSTAEARDLGAAMDAEFYVVGDAQTLRRSSSTKPIYYESYSSVFLISSRSGRLISWQRLSADADEANTAEDKLIKSLSDELVEQLLGAIKKTQVEESNERAIPTSSAPLIEEAPEDDKSAGAAGLRLPRPYRRLRPAYPDSAARAEAEATVDVLVDVGADGEVSQVQVARWAGFGLDETTVATVRQLHFFPALRNGTPIPMRVLLRYNFRKTSQ